MLLAWFTGPCRAGSEIYAYAGGNQYNGEYRVKR